MAAQLSELWGYIPEGDTPLGRQQSAKLQNRQQGSIIRCMADQDSKTAAPLTGISLLVGSDTKGG